MLVKKVKKLGNGIDFSGWDKWREEQRIEVDCANSEPPLNSDDDLNNETLNHTRYVRLFLPEYLVKRALKTKNSDPSLAWLLSAVKQAASF